MNLNPREIRTGSIYQHLGDDSELEVVDMIPDGGEVELENHTHGTTEYVVDVDLDDSALFELIEEGDEEPEGVRERREEIQAAVAAEFQ